MKFGNLSLVPEKRNVVLLCKGFAPGTAFEVGGKELPALRDEKTGEYRVEVGVIETAKGVSVVMKNENGLMSGNENFRERITELLMRSNMENNFKGTWNWIIGEQVRTGYIDPTAFVTAPGNRLGDAILELLRQVIRQKKPVPVPGLPH